MNFTEQEYNEIGQCLDNIVKIVTNKSGALTPTLIKVIDEQGKKRWPTYCSKCSSGRYNIVTRIYRMYLEDSAEKAKQELSSRPVEAIEAKDESITEVKPKKTKKKNNSK